MKKILVEEFVEKTHSGWDIDDFIYNGQYSLGFRISVNIAGPISDELQKDNED